LPLIDASSGVIHVPMFDPKITAHARSYVIQPFEHMISTMANVAADDWMIAVDYHAHEHEDHDRQQTHRCVVLKRLEHLGIRLKVRHIVADHVKAHEQEREAYQEFADALGLALVREQKHHRQADQRQYHHRHVDLEAGPRL